MKDGLSQHDRFNRVHSVKPFKVVDNEIDSLFRRAEVIAGCIRYYHLSGKEDGYFDTFFQHLQTFCEPGGEITSNEEVEPSKALLITFLRQLHDVTHRFNHRWENYISWYLNECLHVVSKDACPDGTWLSFTKNIPKNVLIQRNTGFVFDEAPDAAIYRSTEPILVTNTVIEKAFSLHFDKSKSVYPACLFNLPTALKMKNLLEERQTEELLFDEQNNPKHTQPVGLCISSPVLLLREGKRFVTIAFETEQTSIKNNSHRRNLVRLLHKLQQASAPISRKDAKEVLLVKVFSDIFHLEISSSEGWVPIEKYVIHQPASSPDHTTFQLMLTFELHEHFPETHSCQIEMHQMASAFPSLRILLNRDAWMYPYSWLKDFLIARIHLHTEVLGVNNILVYNELGKVDNSIPFAPFGTNTEQGAWFAVGNYEMSVKNVQTADVRICWQQLPNDEGGLFSYYQGYHEQIDNRSFKMKARYLSDYKWKDAAAPDTLFLFSSVIKNKDGSPAVQQKLSDETCLKNIRLDEMKPVYQPEEEYHYNIRSKTGFLSLAMAEPGMGFGEKTYRRVFSDVLIKKTLRKKKANLINPPITPLVERITLSYKAAETLDFRACQKNGETIVLHIYPLGVKQVYPTAENKPVPFVFSLDTDANLLFGLRNVKGDEFIHLFVDFYPQKKEIHSSHLPRVRWYWGDGYQWQVLPDDAISVNTTQNLLTSGKIKLYLPDIPNESFRDHEGLVWLRAGITQNEKSIAEIRQIYTNAVKVFREPASMEKELPEGFMLNTSEQTLPGIESIIQIIPLQTGYPAEDNVLMTMRISEYISHRNKAVTARDFERMTLQAFPQVGKVKCLPATDTKKENPLSPGTVTLVIVPTGNRKGLRYRPVASAELLLDIERFFSTKVSAFVRNMDAINPIYEEILVRCSLDFYLTEQSRAFSRAVVRRMINSTIAPWQREGNLPVFGYSFALQQLYEQIDKLKFVKKIGHLSVVQLSRSTENNMYRTKEYFDLKDIIKPTYPHAISVPCKHHIIGTEVNADFGVEEMGINEHFVIWPNETGKH